MEAAPPFTAPRPNVQPSRKWYVATLGIAAFGLVVAVVLVVGGVRGTERVGRNLTSVAQGSSGPVRFEEGGSYTLSYIGPGQVSTTADVRRLDADLDPVLRPASGGLPVAMRAYEGTAGIREDPQGTAQYVPLRTFDIDMPGDYVLTADRLEDLPPTFGQVAVGRSPYKPLLDGVLWALGAIAVTLFLSIVATVALAVTRGRAKRAQHGPGGPGPSGGQGWPGPGGPGGQGSDGRWGTGAWPAPAAPPPPPGYGRA